MRMDVTFPGKKRVAARVGHFSVETDQSNALGGEGTAPPPYDLFLASVATCAGVYALGFCQARNLSTDGLHLVVDAQHDPSGMLRAFHMALTLPVDFPDKYRSAIVKAVEQCKVKKAMALQPPIHVVVVDPTSQQKAS